MLRAWRWMTLAGTEAESFGILEILAGLKCWIVNAARLSLACHHFIRPGHIEFQVRVFASYLSLRLAMPTRVCDEVITLLPHFSVASARIHPQIPSRRRIT